MKVLNALRKLLIIALNFVKLVMFFTGIFGMIIFCLAIDSEGEVGNMCIRFFFYSAIMTAASIGVEAFIVNVLLKRNERLNTLFGFYRNQNVEPILNFDTTYTESYIGLSEKER